MPIYEYRCESCGYELEAIQKFSDAPLTDCPTCGKPELKKLVSAAGFQLKGTGWYVTDFKNKGKAPEKKESNESGNGASHGCGSGACSCAQSS
jgi:putative FmdB family regulatory protein